MKTRSLLALSIVALLCASGLKAQDTSIVMPNQGQPNLYAEVGIVASTTSLKGVVVANMDWVSSKSQSYAGPMLAFGWRLAPQHKVQLQLEYQSAKLDWNLDINHTNVKVTEDFKVMPILASYSYCYQFDQAGKWEGRVTPSLGFLSFKYKVSAMGDSDSCSKTTYAYGIGVGVTYHFNKQWYIDGGLRYLGSGAVDIKPAGYDVGAKNSSIGMTSFSVSGGFKF